MDQYSPESKERAMRWIW